jgi:hypothetical protein
VQEVKRVAHEQVHHAALPTRRHANPRRYVFASALRNMS